MKESTCTTFLKRRQFLRTSTLGLAAVAADQKSGILSAQPLGLPIGLELFTVRYECEQDFPGTLEKVAAIGYKEVELFDFYGRKASEVRRLVSCGRPGGAEQPHAFIRSEPSIPAFRSQA